MLSYFPYIFYINAANHKERNGTGKKNKKDYKEYIKEKAMSQSIFWFSFKKDFDEI